VNRAREKVWVGRLRPFTICGEETMRPPEKMIIYNLFPLLAGKFTNWTKHLLRASEMGFNWIFVNPIQCPGKSGSLYSIRDYFGFNPVLVDQESKKTPEEQVRGMVGKAEELGLKWMVDLVINHSSADSDLLTSHPEWFLWDRKGQVAHPFCNENGKRVVWKDLAKFDHKNTKDKEGLFRFFLDVVKFLMGLGFKGFRCDAAYQVPRGLWERLIHETKKTHPDVVFFAETWAANQTKPGRLPKPVLIIYSTAPSGGISIATG
jgi:starch synthase (maltosyl-transferring)